MSLLSRFMPSWQFYKDIGTELILEVQRNDQWTPLFPKLDRKLYHLFVNHESSFQLLVQRQLYNLALEPECEDTLKWIQKVVQFETKQHEFRIVNQENEKSEVFVHVMGEI